MKISLEELGVLRDKLHNLDLSNLKHQKIYDEAFFELISDTEEERLKVYGDKNPNNKNPKGKRTIGYGFNMNAGISARILWSGAFGDSLDFDEVYNGKEITPIQARTLFNYVRDIKRSELRRSFRDAWDKLKANEKFMIEDLYYNGGNRLVGKFSADIKEYVKTSDATFLKDALRKIKNECNDAVGSSLEKGVQARRDSQYTLGNSLDCPCYRKPHQSPLPDPSHKRTAILGKTIIPYKHGNESCYYSDKFYIWRTVGDNRVRSSHQANEGKIFSLDDPSIKCPKEDYGCRCEADHYLPHYVELPSFSEAKMIRKFINPREIPGFETKDSPRLLWVA